MQEIMNLWIVLLKTDPLRNDTDFLIKKSCHLENFSILKIKKHIMKQKSTRVRGSWKDKIVASELAEERAKCDFDQKEALDIVWRPMQIAKINEAS